MNSKDKASKRWSQDRFRRLVNSSKVKRVSEKYGDLIANEAGSVWRWTRNNPEFPKPIRLSAGCTVRDEDELIAWIASKRDNVLCQPSPHRGERSV